MHATSSYRGDKPTNKQTHKQTGAITIHCAAASLARSVMNLLSKKKQQCLHNELTVRHNAMR